MASEDKKGLESKGIKRAYKIPLKILFNLLSQGQILGTGNLPQDSAPVCINIDIFSEMAAHSVQRSQAFCVTASDWSPITSA